MALANVFKIMEESKLNYESPAIKEARRIAEIKKLSYEERLHRMLVLMEVSYALKNAQNLKLII